MAETADLQAALNALRARGAAERDPVRFAYLEALTRRAAAQPEAVQKSLNTTLMIQFADACRKLASRPPAPAKVIPTEDASTPLADLLAYIRQHGDRPPETPHAGPAPELRSIARFHETWARLSSEQQLTQTLAQAPGNAGPMNSQHLVLRSLQLMRDIAPDYLQSFMSYIDTLIWMELAELARATGRSSTGERENKSPTTKRSGPNR